MKNLIAAILLLCCVLAISASAQNASSHDDQLGSWSAGVFAGGGTGLNDRTDVQMFRAGARVGHMIGGQHRFGSFEWNGEVTPIDYVLWSGYKNVYGFGVNPLILKWNFPTHRGSKFAPFFLAHGGMLFSTDNVPPGDTSKINFTSGAGIGTHIFTRENRAVTFDVRAIHLSNASLGNHNPGINASLQFTLGYTWFRK